jgi:hypothetical protein
MRILYLVLFALLATAPAATAQQLLGGYYAVLGPQDHYNSRGTRLTDIGAILQQDRANFHRFGIPDAADQGDGFFWDAAQRAQIPSIWRRGDGFNYIIQSAAPNFPVPIYVQIYGYGNQISFIVVNFGAG